MIPTRALSSAHEPHVADMMPTGRVARGSGCTYRDQGDGRQRAGSVRFAWDCKATLAKSISLRMADWEKIVEQAHGDRPMLALGMFDSERVDRLVLDLAVTSLADLSELSEHSQCRDEALALLARVSSCEVTYPDRYGDSGMDDLVADLTAVLNGRPATRGEGL